MTSDRILQNIRKEIGLVKVKHVKYSSEDIKILRAFIKRAGVGIIQTVCKTEGTTYSGLSLL